MSRLEGSQITSACCSRASQRQLAECIVQTLIAKPVFSAKESAIFHGDPHAGNLLAMSSGCLGIIDWSLAGRLSQLHREAIAQVLVGIAACDAIRVCRAIESLATGSIDNRALVGVVNRFLEDSREDLPSLDLAIRLLDRAARCGIRFDRDLMLFRKSYFTLEGVTADIDPNRNVGTILACNAVCRLLVEWPLRAFAPPDSRGLPSHISTFDLLFVTTSMWARSMRSWFGDECGVRTNLGVRTVLSC